MSSDNLKFTLCSIVERNKLNVANFPDCDQNSRIVLKPKGRENVSATPIPVLTNASNVEEKTD